MQAKAISKISTACKRGSHNSTISKLLTFGVTSTARLKKVSDSDYVTAKAVWVVTTNYADSSERTARDGDAYIASGVQDSGKRSCARHRCFVCFLMDSALAESTENKISTLALRKVKSEAVDTSVTANLTRQS